MSDRPTAVNGKRNQAWGTTSACPECGECLCFACHPEGPCVDEHDAAGKPVALQSSPETVGYGLQAQGSFPALLL